MTNNLKWLFVSQQSLTQSLFFLNGTAVFDDVANFFWTEVRFFSHLFPGIQGILGVGVGLGYSGRGLALYT